MRAVQNNKWIVPGAVSLMVLIVWAGPARAVPIKAQYLDDPRCDPVPDQETTHELGDASVFPIDEALFIDAQPTSIVKCVGDDGIANDWEVRMTNLSPIAWKDLFFVADDGVSVGNADGIVVNPASAADPPTDAFRIDGTVTVTGGNDTLVFESGIVNEILEPGESWIFYVSNFLPSSGIFPPTFGSPGAYGAASTTNPLSNASILANVVPEPASILLLSGAGLALLRRRRSG